MQEMPSNDIVKRNEEIYNLLAANDIEQAIKRLMDFINDFSPKHTYLETAISINRDYQQLLAEKDTSDNFKDQRKYLIHKMFELMDAIEQDLLASL